MSRTRGVRKASYCQSHRHKTTLTAREHPCRREQVILLPGLAEEAAPLHAAVGRDGRRRAWSWEGGWGGVGWGGV